MILTYIFVPAADHDTEMRRSANLLDMLREEDKRLGRTGQVCLGTPVLEIDQPHLVGLKRYTEDKDTGFNRVRPSL